MKYIIAGFGKFGRLALSRLSSVFPDSEIVIVDPDLDPSLLQDGPAVPQVSQLPKIMSYCVADGLRDPLTTDNAGPLNLRSGIPQAVAVKRSEILATAIKGDVVTYLTESLSPTSDDIILPMVPFHLAASYLISQGPETKEVALPEQIQDTLPNPVWLSDSTICCTRASFICLDDCPEGELCAVTGKPREEPLYQALEKIRIPGFKMMVQRSFQILPGIGGYLFGDLIRLRDRIHRGRYIVATSCKCHGILTGIRNHEEPLF